MSRTNNTSTTPDNITCVCFQAYEATNFTTVDEALDYIRRVKQHTTLGGTPCYCHGLFGKMSRDILLTRVRFRDSSLFNVLTTLDEINSLFTFADD